MRRSRALLVALFLLVPLVLVGFRRCGPSDPGDDGPPSIAGTVTHVDVARNTLRVEENPSEQAGSAKAMVRVDERTRLVLPAGASGDAPRSVAAIPLGSRVRVWFAGPVAESYPVQARAATIVVDAVGAPTR